MNTVGTPDDRMLDRLVDDELDERQRRELLVRLQASPDGWRRCALAFLQQQAWRRAMRGVARGLPRDSGQGPTTPAEWMRHVQRKAARPSGGRLRSGTWCMLAASLLIAFGLGAMWQRGRSTHPAGRHPSIQAVPEWAGPARVRVRPGERGDRASDLPVAVAEKLPAGPQRQAFAASGHMPVSADHLLEVLRRSGHQVHRRTGWMPFSSDDGRQGYIPVEDLYVVPADYGTY